MYIAHAVIMLLIENCRELKSLKKHLNPLCEDPVGEEEDVEEVDREETEVCQSLRSRKSDDFRFRYL